MFAHETSQQRNGLIYRAKRTLLTCLIGFRSTLKAHNWSFFLVSVSHENLKHLRLIALFQIGFMQRLIPLCVNTLAVTKSYGGQSQLLIRAGTPGLSPQPKLLKG